MGRRPSWAGPIKASWRRTQHSPHDAAVFTDYGWDCIPASWLACGYAAAKVKPVVVTAQHRDDTPAKLDHIMPEVAGTKITVTKKTTVTKLSQQPTIIDNNLQELFERIAERADEKAAEISLSYLEIYNETIRDLLDSSTTRNGLQLREDANQAVSVIGLSSHHPQNVQEVMDMIVRGNECRTMSPTPGRMKSETAPQTPVVAAGLF